MANSIHTLFFSGALALTAAAAPAQGLLGGVLGTVGDLGEATPSTTGTSDPADPQASPSFPDDFGAGGGGCPGGVCAAPGDQNANGVDDITEAREQSE